MNCIKVFNNEEFGNLRMVEIDGEPWAVGKDVAEALGYSNPQKAIRDHVDDEDKGVNEMFTPGGRQQIAIINESGMYSLILSSKLPSAKRFKHWVTSEVLPSIRKHGGYAIDAVLADPDAAIAMLTELKKEREESEKLKKAVAVQNQQLLEMKPKASYYDVVLNCKDLISTSAIAKDYGKSATWFNKTLHEFGIHYKQGGLWLLYQKYADKGYTSTKTHTYLGYDERTHTKIHTYWTQKGRLFLYETLKKRGILPLIERDLAAAKENGEEQAV